jgi:hypothetical protein
VNIMNCFDLMGIMTSSVNEIFVSTDMVTTFSNSPTMQTIRAKLHNQEYIAHRSPETRLNSNSGYHRSTLKLLQHIDQNYWKLIYFLISVLYTQLVDSSSMYQAGRAVATLGRSSRAPPGSRIDSTILIHDTNYRLP